MNVNVASVVDAFAEELTWTRYEYTVTSSHNRTLDMNTPVATNTIMGAVQTLDSEVIWQEGGTVNEEDRQLFVHYPVRKPNGDELSIYLTTRPEEDEDPAYVDIITYEGQDYDIIGLIDDYKEAYYQSYLITRVSNN